MFTRRSGSRPKLRPTIAMASQAQYNSFIPIFDFAFVSILYISSAFGLSTDPTRRYMNEMRRLLRDNDFSIQVSAEAPLTDPTALETEANLAWVDSFGAQEENSWSQYKYLPLDEMIDIPMPTSLDESIIDPGTYESPQPPQDPRYNWVDHDFSDESFYPQPNGEEQYQQSQQWGYNNEVIKPFVDYQEKEQSYRPQRFTDLFDVVNEQIAAFGHQIQESSRSLRSVIDTKFSHTDSDWEYENPGYMHRQSELEGFALELSKSELADEFESSYEHESYEDTHEYSQINGQLHDQTPGIVTGHQNHLQQLENKNKEVDLFAVNGDSVEKKLLKQEQENERIEREQLEQAYLNRLRAEVARVKISRQEKEAFVREAENEKLNTRQPMSIIKSRAIYQLPDTNDPLELLGLDHSNPPQTVNDIRRAFLRMAKKYHPDAIAADATPEERERASMNFARINSAYQLLKDKQERLGDNYFATMMGGPMYEPRNSHVRQSFSRGYGYDDYGSIFSGNSYSARYGPKHGGQPRPQNGNNRNYSYGATKSPFRRYRQEVGDNCHVSGEEFPPFFNS